MECADEVVYNDLGSILKPDMNSEEINGAIKSLSSRQKYKLLTDHFIPNHFCFPKVFNNGCNRSFQHSWLEKYPWLVYSKVLDGAFCKFCALLVKERARYGKLVNVPFKAWIKVHIVVGGHASNRYHVNAVADAMAFINSIENPVTNVDVRMNAKLLHTIQQNRQILKFCIESVLHCGRQASVFVVTGKI